MKGEFRWGEYTLLQSANGNFEGSGNFAASYWRSGRNPLLATYEPDMNYAANIEQILLLMEISIFLQDVLTWQWYNSIACAVWAPATRAPAGHHSAGLQAVDYSQPQGSNLRESHHNTCSAQTLEVDEHIVSDFSRITDVVNVHQK